jgi:RsiW-degrading membrane proteinase PrsW (M82 family)
MDLPGFETFAASPVTAPAGPRRMERLPTQLWKHLLAGGAAVWLFAAAITEITGDDILIPTVIVVGSFLVPVTLAAFALSRRADGQLTIEAVVFGFLAAGTLGVVTTALLETYVVPAAAGTFVAVGVIEETAKGVLVLVIARRLRHDDARDGMVLGAVVGAGFAAFESSGYALQTMLDHGRGQAVIDIMETEATRAMLAPFGHILWTALLGGALFASTRGGRFTVTRRLVLTFVGVVTLHALWDETYGWAIMIGQGVAGAGWDLIWPNAQAWIETPTASARLWFNVSYDVLLALNALVGSLWLAITWRRAVTPEAAARPARPPVSSPS